MGPFFWKEFNDVTGEGWTEMIAKEDDRMALLTQRSLPRFVHGNTFSLYVKFWNSNQFWVQFFVRISTMWGGGVNSSYCQRNLEMEHHASFAVLGDGSKNSIVLNRLIECGSTELNYKIKQLYLFNKINGLCYGQQKAPPPLLSSWGPKKCHTFVTSVITTAY